MKKVTPLFPSNLPLKVEVLPSPPPPFLKIWLEVQLPSPHTHIWRMEPSGTPALTAYSYEDLPSRTTWSQLLLKKEEIRLNIWPEIPQELSLWKRPVCQTLSKALDILSATARVAPDVLKVPAILSDTTVRESAVGREDLKRCWKSETRPYFSRWSIILLFTRLY